MGCHEKTIDHLRALGYNAVRLPKADLKPMELLSLESHQLTRYGKLQSVFLGAPDSVPAVHRDLAAPNILGNQSSAIKAGIALSVLGNIVQAMGGSSVGLSLAYQAAKTITFEYTDVKEDRIDLSDLDAFLAAADVNPLSVNASLILERDGLYVINSILRSTEITVSAQDGRGAGIELDLSVLQESVGVPVSVDTAGGRSTAITYSASDYLAFAFQAVELHYSDGVYASFEPKTGRVLRGGASAEPETNLLRLSSPFARMDEA